MAFCVPAGHSEAGRQGPESGGSALGITKAPNRVSGALLPDSGPCLAQKAASSSRSCSRISVIILCVAPRILRASAVKKSFPAGQGFTGK
jgi:hypothetical protein